MPATVGALVWARLEHPRAFGLARDAFLATQALVVAGYLLAPTAPPRLLSGGVEVDGWHYTVQSPYAAMPSGHVAFAVVAAGIVCALAPWRWGRVLAVAYPLLVTVIVLGTANHFWIDAAAGASAAASGFGLAVIGRTLIGRSRDEHVGSDASPPRRGARSASPA